MIQLIKQIPILIWKLLILITMSVFGLFKALTEICKYTIIVLNQFIMVLLLLISITACYYILTIPFLIPPYYAFLYIIIALVVICIVDAVLDWDDEDDIDGDISMTSYENS